MSIDSFEIKGLRDRLQNALNEIEVQKFIINSIEDILDDQKISEFAESFPLVMRILELKKSAE